MGADFHYIVKQTSLFGESNNARRAPIYCEPTYTVYCTVFVGSVNGGHGEQVKSMEALLHKAYNYKHNTPKFQNDITM